MTKADLVQAVLDELGDEGITRKRAAEFVDLVFETMKNNMAVGKDVKISGFGKFNVKRKNERRGRNPQTGESLTISQRTVVTFKASKILTLKINKPSGLSLSQDNV